MQALKSSASSSSSDEWKKGIDQNEVLELDLDSDMKLGGRWWSRSRYTGALLFNVCTFVLPALYGTLSKLWVANIDNSMVVTTDGYTYLGIVAEIVNEGLPRASYILIADRFRSSQSQLAISHTLILVQSIIGIILSIIFLGAARNFASAFSPVDVQDASTTYIRISSFSVFFSAVDVSVSVATRCLDRPDVPLLISVVKVLINIILDLIFISTVRVPGIEPTVNTQATIRLVCDGVGALAGVIYFIYITHRIRQSGIHIPRINLSWDALKILVREGWPTFLESAWRNALYLWLTSGIVALGSSYATAWGIFNTIRWGLVMVPVASLEATSNIFVGHEWAVFRRLSAELPVTWRRLFRVAKPALVSVVLALGVEVVLCLMLSFGLSRPYAYWLSNAEDVADITSTMWRTIDWCYIFYAVNAQLSTILLASQPRWYLINSFVVNTLWTLPWAIAVTQIDITPENAWTYYSVIFGGSLVASFIVTMVILAIWTKRILRSRDYYFAE